jgi:cyclase
MIQFRVIPIILIDGQACYKTIKFNKKIYLGDPINIIKIFNDLEVDELMIFDISKSKDINYKILEKISQESFIPLTYGGKIKNRNDVTNIINLGFEKISINTMAIENQTLVKEIIEQFGSSTISISINLKKNIFNKYKIYNHFLKKKMKFHFIEYIKNIDKLNPSEIVVTFVDTEGMQSGFDINVVKEIKKNINSNLVVNGGLRNFKEIIDIKNLGLSGVGASRFFFFKESLDSILINYIDAKTKKIIHENTNFCI